MAKKPTLFLVLLLIAGSFVYINRDWFKRRPIQITHRFHAFGGRFDNGGGVAPMLFEFDRPVQITAVKVIPVGETETNQFPHALWSLTGNPKSVVLRGFLYGQDIPGMRRVFKDVSAEALSPEQRYRLVVEAGSLKSQHDFDLDPSVH